MPDIPSVMFNIHGLKARFDSISSSNVTGELNLVRRVGHNVEERSIFQILKGKK